MTARTGLSWSRDRSRCAPGPRDGRTGPSFADATPEQVRATLIPEEAVEFDQRWREAMVEATQSLDLAGVLARLGEWRSIARRTAARGAEEHRALYWHAAVKLTGAELPPDMPLHKVKALLGL
ncbi:DUF6247 family protein [Lentzea sp. NPDC042327]|uniref:DUF6247 family protein n=1 Tax=Lentzea sp. NPDC042327 TaxID=3154801 RepID=UPI0033D5092B